MENIFMVRISTNTEGGNVEEQAEVFRLLKNQLLLNDQLLGTKTVNGNTINEIGIQSPFSTVATLVREVEGDGSIPKSNYSDGNYEYQSLLHKINCSLAIAKSGAPIIAIECPDGSYDIAYWGDIRKTVIIIDGEPVLFGSFFYPLNHNKDHSKSYTIKDGELSNDSNVKCVGSQLRIIKEGRLFSNSGVKCVRMCLDGARYEDNVHDKLVTPILANIGERTSLKHTLTKY